MLSHKTPIIFFDGTCILCNRLATILLIIDKKKKLYMAPLQGKTAKEKLPVPFVKALNTICFLVDDTVYTKSTAIIKIAIKLGGVWQVFWVVLIIPKIIRDMIYTIIAKNRSFLFKDSISCKPLSLEKIERVLP